MPDEKLESFDREEDAKRRLALTQLSPGSQAQKADICIIIHLSNKFLQGCHAVS